MTTKTLEQLERDAQAAQRRHDAAQQAAEDARRHAEQQRAARLREFDRAVLDAFDDEALAEQVHQAQRALDEAVANSTLGAAWVALKVAQLRRAHLSDEAAAAAARLGDPRTITPRPASEAVFEELARSVDRVTDRLAADEFDARTASRDAAAEG